MTSAQVRQSGDREDEVSTAEQAREKNRQRQFHSAKDYEQSASQIGDIVVPDLSERRKAALVVAGNVPKDEVAGVLMMLGIHPKQPDFEEGPGMTAPRLFNGSGPKGS